MPQFSAKSSKAAAVAARAYLAEDHVTRTTRGNPTAPRKLTVIEVAALHHATEALTKKYIRLLKAGEALPTRNKGGGHPALTEAEEKALVTYIRSVGKSAFAVTEACIRNYANFIRKYRIDGPVSPVSKSWTRRFKDRHPELMCKKPKIKEITRAGAELDIDGIDAWFKEYKAILLEFCISVANLWNFDETPLQLGWVETAVRVFSTRMKKNTRPVTFQPGNKKSLTSVDAVNAAGRAIPSFLILSAKVLLEEYAMADIYGDVVLTQTSSGFNNSHRARQWLQHFNRHSFACSDDFNGFTIETWFGYASDLTRSQWDQQVAYTASFMTRKTKPVFRMLLMDGFNAHEDPEFIWYCDKFDIIPFCLPSHTSHLLQPLDVGVYQHLKREQREALTDFMIAGGMQINRYNFLNQWDRLYRAAFKACYIYVGFEKAGLMPLNPEAVLGPLRQAALGLEEPLFPKLLHQGTVTPRKAKRDFATIQKKLEILSSPTRAKVTNVGACLDLAILTQSAHKRIIKLQQDRIRHESRRTKTLRRIKVGDGALTMTQLQEKVAQRAHDEQIKEAKRHLRVQESQFRDMWKQAEATRKAVATAEAARRPRLYGRAAARAKREKEAAEAAADEDWRRSLITPEELEAIEGSRRRWIEATDANRSFYFTTFPKGHLDAILEVATWVESRAITAPTATLYDDEVDEADEAETSDSNADDFYSVTSSLELPPLYADESYDSDDVEIITQPQIHTTAQALSNLQQINDARENEDESQDQLHTEGYGGFGYDRVRNTYSDDEEAEPTIRVGGRDIPVPKIQRRV